MYTSKSNRYPHQQKNYKFKVYRVAVSYELSTSCDYSMYLTRRTETEMQRLFEAESSTVRYSNIIFQQTYLPHTETQFILCLKCVLLTLLGQFSFDSLQTEGGLLLLSSCYPTSYRVQKTVWNKMFRASSRLSFRPLRITCTLSTLGTVLELWTVVEWLGPMELERKPSGLL